MIYLDNAATTSPKPEIVIKEINNALRKYSANPGRGGHTPSIQTARAVYQTRTLAKELFHAAAQENVIFTSGCTQSLNTVIKGVLKPGDHVVISSMEHNAVVRPLYRLKQKGLIEYSTADVIIGDDDATLNAFRKAINAKTRMIICTHASNVFGTRLPVERICALAHSYGILFCLDAAQSAGFLDIDIADNGYDFVCCPGHKGLYGPTGIGLLLIKSNQLLDTLTEGGTGSDSVNPVMPDYYPDRLESGTLNIPGICGLGAGIRFIDRYGIDKMRRHEYRLMKMLYHGLRSVKNIRLYTDEPDIRNSVPVISFNIGEVESEKIAAYLNNRGIAVRAGLHCAPSAHRMMGTLDSGTVRIAPSVFTEEKDIQILMIALKKFSYFS